MVEGVIKIVLIFTQNLCCKGKTMLKLLYMILIRYIHNLFGGKKSKNPREVQIRQYTKDAIKTYKKTLRKLAHE